MNKFFEKLESTLGPVAGKLQSNRYLKAICNGFYIATPLIIIGSIFLLICFIPIRGYGDFMAGIFGANWMAPLLKIFNATMNILGIFVLIGISASLAKHYGMDVIASVAATVACYAVIVPDFASAELTANNTFLVMLVGILTVEILHFVIKRNWTIKMPASVPEPVQASFSALIPALIALVIAAIVNLLFGLTSFGTLGNFINTVVQLPLQKVGGTLPAMILISFFECLFWFFGIHGSNVTGAVANPILNALTAENAAATAAGLAPTNIINAQFWSNFMHLGGAAATIGIVVIILFFARSKRYKSLGRLCAGPSIFQINEPVIFGFPLVLNPLMFIPMLLGQIVNAVVSYVAFATGLVPIIKGAGLTWTTPPIMSGFLLCGWRGAVLQLVLIVLNVLIWFPFVRIADRAAAKEETAETVEAK